MKASTIQAAFEQGAGVLRLIPAFVTMGINQAGGRLHLHPDDWFPNGLAAGSVKERWLGSVLQPRRESTSGLSFVSYSDDPADRFALPEAIDVLGADLIGADLLSRYGTWPVHAKFFDYHHPLFVHIHLGFEQAERVGAKGKPEAYFFPAQLNNHPGARPSTYFGLAEGVTKDMLIDRLKRWEQGDTHILELSRAYHLQTGTGWYTPPGTLHAPGSLLTYEVQWNSTSGAVFENVLQTSGETYEFGLWRALPPELKGDWDAVIGLLDWEVNTDPLYRQHYYREPKPVQGDDSALSQRWVIYDTPYFSAKEVTVLPGQGATLRDEGTYGLVVIQGHGKIGAHEAEAPGLLRYGGLSADEFFVGHSAARQGVRVENHSKIEPLVLLQCFGPKNS